MFTFVNSPYPQLLVDMLLALVQRLFWARISRQFASISIDGIMCRCMKRIILQVRTGLCAFCTNSVFAFLNSTYPQLLADMLLALVQRLFWLRLTGNLREFPLTDLCTEEGSGLFRRSVPVCPLFAQTQCLHF